ncbi:MAG: transposase [Patescibacteria group bacterium]|nr:transposase [Patescibacteria group bacterium]
MRPDYKPNLKNRPIHIKQDNSFYFITVRTVRGQWFLQPEKYKKILFNTIKEKTSKFSSSLIAYVILQNHYHLILKVTKSQELSKIIREINGASARAINKIDYAIDRKIWWNYYDHVIRDDKDFFKHLNYIHQNPIKHGLTKGFSYNFSSYDAWVSKKGKEYLDDAFEKYPIVDFVMLNDDF